MYATAIGKKWVMAITGLILMSFLVVHLLGNIKLYLSKEELNLYGEALRDIPGHLLPHTWLLWGFRIGLIGAFFFHIHAAYGLTRINMKARPDRYQSKRDYVAADFASRTMSGSSARTAPSTLIITGKNTISTQTRIFG